MKWIPRSNQRQRPRPGHVAALTRAIAVAPANPRLHAEIAEARMRIGDSAGAASAFAEAERLDSTGFSAWDRYAKAMLAHDTPEALLALCDRALEGGASPALCHYRGIALRRLGRMPEAIAEFERALAEGNEFRSLKTLLRLHARQRDGGPLLDLCDTLPEMLRATAAVRAHRAIALSRLGRDDEARAIVDVHRQVERIAFEPPPEFGGIETFNAMLAAEILRDPPPAPSADGFEINYTPVRDQPAHDALAAFTRAALESYVSQRARFGLEAMPPAPTHASLGCTTTVLRRDGSNGEHIHPRNYVSSVYHVTVPRVVRESGDNRGALLLGGCTVTACGYQGIWGTRHIKPVAGVLNLFPSHIFHDVVPTGSEEPRITVAADLHEEAG